MANDRDKSLYVYVHEIPKEFSPRDYVGQLILRNVGQCFVQQSDSGHTRLQLLESSSVSYDGLRYRFELKKGCKFHCGKDITSDDAIVAILRVLKDKDCSSQLTARIASTSPGVYEINRLSKRRFEIILREREKDFLDRFSLAELTMRHEKCGSYSGDWIIEEHLEDKITLSLSKQSSTGNSPYERVVILPYSQRDDFNYHITDQAFVFIYPGIGLKSPESNDISTEYSEALTASYSFFLVLDPQLERKQLIKSALLAAANLAYTGGSAYRRDFNNSLFPKEHVFFKQRPTHVKVKGMEGSERLCLNLAIAAPLFCKRQQNYLTNHAAKIGLDLSFDKSAQQHGKVCSIYIDHPHSTYQVRQEIREVLGLRLEDGPRLIQQLQNISADPAVVPLFVTPVVLRSNRSIDWSPREHLPLRRVQESAEAYQRSILKDNTLKAIGSIFPMLAHDIKKPLSLMQSILDLLQAAEPHQVKSLLRRYQPQIRRTIRTTDQLMQDIVEIGSGREPFRESHHMEDIIDSVVRDVFAFTAPEKLTLSYSLQHTRPLFVDVYKAGRVLSNIITNALQAVDGQGKIWFRSQDVGAQMCELTIGNSGKIIPERELPGLFEQFYSKGKRRGTGLGLAIVKKIIGDHGGKVWCVSSGAVGTEFTMHWPTAQDKLPKWEGHLPVDGLTAAKPEAIPQLALKQAGPFAKVLVVDDDPIYSQMLKEQMASLSKEIEVMVCGGFDSAAQLLENFVPEFAIVDVFLEFDRPIGFDVVQMLKRVAPSCRVCLHSNAAPFEMHRRAFEIGADLFLPKPANKEQLSGLMGLESSKIHQETRVQALRQLPICVIVDDDTIFLEAWGLEGRLKIMTYSSPEQCLEAMASANPDLRAAVCIVCDYHFDGSELTGIDLARHLRRLGFSKDLFLSTEIPIELSSDFDGQFSKDRDTIVKAILHRLRS